MAINNKFLQMILLFLSVIVILSCSLVGRPEGEQPDASAVETEIAIGIMSTSLANQQMTLQAMQAQMTLHGAPVTEEYAKSIGADAFAPDSSSATRIARQLMP